MLISCLAFVAALYLLHRLVELDCGRRLRAGRWPVVVFPTAFFFSAVYTESLFFALSLGAVYAARRGRWTVAGVAAASLGHSQPGVLLLLPLALMLLYGPRADRPPMPSRGWRPRYRLSIADAGWLPLVLAGIAAYCAYMWGAFGDPLRPFEVQREVWPRHLVVPLVGAGRGWNAGLGVAERQGRRQSGQ